MDQYKSDMDLHKMYRNSDKKKWCDLSLKVAYLYKWYGSTQKGNIRRTK